MIPETFVEHGRSILIDIVHDHDYQNYVREIVWKNGLGIF